MSVLEGRYDDRRVLVDLLILRPAPTNDLTAIPVAALLDTGATTSAVSRRIVRELTLPALGKRLIHTANGELRTERRAFRIGFPGQSGYPFVFDEVLGFELHPSATFDALIGMDINRQCDLHLTRDRRCRLTFGL